MALPGNRPPDCTGAVASPSQLWPPNQKFVDVSIVGVKRSRWRSRDDYHQRQEDQDDREDTRPDVEADPKYGVMMREASTSSESATAPVRKINAQCRVRSGPTIAPSAARLDLTIAGGPAGRSIIREAHDRFRPCAREDEIRRG